ncbi:hypothetical protein H8S90_13760 [Olivibacter sp. SDN3]|uniref:hypothetical protein n=1 Tax=Olivibacter sp. SDN3 TaxID=2764720 RepID=UPI001650EED9|nr:hypothetical protein [Olivibacter sp. SDN3]QNL47885.1 hypothetical protein H8S90_13760 [Olivibacter sp. SDN3]
MKEIRTSYYIITFLLSLFYLHANAQPNNEKEIEELFKKNADSTIIFQGITPMANVPDNLFIVSKKDDTVSLFTYHYSRRDIPAYAKLPQTLGNHIRNKKYDRKGFRIDRFFDVYDISTEKGGSLWQELMAYKPWQLRDDKVYGSGCPVEPKITTFEDGSSMEELKWTEAAGHSYLVKLITEDSTKQLLYSSPEDLDKWCEPKEGRQHIIKIKELLLTYFGKDSVFWENPAHTDGVK